ncbi:MAG: amidohydrolase family protein [Actinomycetota bacterium]
MQRPKRRLGRCVAFFLLLLPACSSSGEPARGDGGGTLVRVRTMFDGADFHSDYAVLVNEGVISAVGPADEIGNGTEETVDLGAATLLPGVIDLHVHLGSVYSYDDLPEKGVTTVRDLATEDILASPEPRTLRVIAAGPIITVPGGYPIPVWGSTIAAPIDGPDEARAKVRGLADKGAGVIKIAITEGFKGSWPTLSVPETRAIVEQAHARGLIVTAHLDDAAGVRRALQGGVDEWAHIPCFEVPTNLLRQAVARGIDVVATLHVQRGCPASMRNAKAFVAAGGTLLYGSDLGNAGIPFGIDVTELELMKRSGLSVEEALASATSLAGKALGLRVGSLSPGAPADLIAVAGNVRRDMSLLSDPIFVMADGEVILESGEPDELPGATP